MGDNGNGEDNLECPGFAPLAAEVLVLRFYPDYARPPRLHVNNAWVNALVSSSTGTYHMCRGYDAVSPAREGHRKACDCLGQPFTGSALTELENESLAKYSVEAMASQVGVELHQRILPAINVSNCR